MRDQIDTLDDSAKDPSNGPGNYIAYGLLHTSSLLPIEPGSESTFQRINLGAAQQPCSYDSVEALHASNPAFANFRKRLATFFSHFLGKNIQLDSDELVCQSALPIQSSY